MDDNIHWKVDMFDFSDNDHFSNLDCLIVQLGECEVIVAAENLEDRTGKKLQAIFSDHNLSVSTCKRSAFKIDSSDPFLKLGTAATHITNSAEIERPLGLLCLHCLCNQLDLLNNDDNFGRYEFGFGSLSKYMKMDSLGAAAIHLLPKADDPSPYASLYGVLNRCRTKVGARLLDR
jgi:DNA mismatch repair protein MSH2